MGCIRNKDAKNIVLKYIHAYAVEGLSHYEEGCIIAVCMTRDLAVKFVAKYESDHPNHNFDSITIWEVELVTDEV